MNLAEGEPTDALLSFFSLLLCILGPLVIQSLYRTSSNDILSWGVFLSKLLTNILADEDIVSHLGSEKFTGSLTVFFILSC